MSHQISSANPRELRGLSRFESISNVTKEMMEVTTPHLNLKLHVKPEHSVQLLAEQSSDPMVRMEAYRYLGSELMPSKVHV
jgi:hypothetical protein